MSDQAREPRYYLPATLRHYADREQTHNGLVLAHSDDLLAAADEIEAERAAREQAEQALREARDWYRDHVGGGIYDEAMWGDPFAISQQLRAALAASGGTGQ